MRGDDVVMVSRADLQLAVEAIILLDGEWSDAMHYMNDADGVDYEGARAALRELLARLERARDGVMA